VNALRAIWDFIAGDSRYAPLGLACTVLAVLLALRTGWPMIAVELLFPAGVAASLAAAVFER